MIGREPGSTICSYHGPSTMDYGLSRMNEAEKDPQHHIIIKGARVHNLKNMDVAIPKKQAGSGYGHVRLG